ncbi:hypothetical protein [Agrobacterium vitis]|uniref:hypothetical protein n=1 Tax=Agrobacterium vitis TaxID=373 RepID=UPI0012E82461|nr:hypothetical protein [Agrobacterium vitis]MUZ65140.1 hypothetical protein [Agrobacterium vitis]
MKISQAADAFEIFSILQVEDASASSRLGISGANVYAGAAIGGAVAGTTAGLASGLGAGVYGASVASGVTGNVAAGVAEKAFNGQAPTVAGVAGDAMSGAVFGVVGGAVGSKVSGSLQGLSAAQKGKLGEGLTTFKELFKGNIDLGKIDIPAGGLTSTGRDRVARIYHEFQNIFTGNTKAVESKFGKSAGLTKNQRDALAQGGEFDVNRMTPDSVSGFASGTASGSAAAGEHSQADYSQKYQD